MLLINCAILHDALFTSRLMTQNFGRTMLEFNPCRFFFLDILNVIICRLPAINLAAQRLQMEQCMTNMDRLIGGEWLSAHVAIKQKFAEYRNRTEELREQLREYHAELAEAISSSKNEEMFNKSNSTYRTVVMSVVPAAEEHVGCFRDIVTHQLTDVVGRCRPLHNIYTTTYKMICGALAPSAAIITLSLLLLSVAVVLVSLVLAASIPYFKKMRELHPADKLIIERERASNKDNPTSQAISD